MFKIRGSANPDGTIRKYSEFPTETQISPARFVATKEPALVADGRICVTGEIPRETSFEKGLNRQRAFVNGVWQPDPLILDDRAVVLNVKGKGLVVVSGCAHAGIINTVAYARRITGVNDVYGVLGGFHLAGKENEAKIEPTVEELKRFNPRLIAPSHCTGWRAMFAVAEALPDAFVWNCVGNLYKIRAESAAGT
jgi:7,8-dihydropterin-6-yl-methyl-4-(beta-D-ribofuranosyl)aminobenzene 5'-phosphate synthase